jgi:hypothetical protein
MTARRAPAHCRAPNPSGAVPVSKPPGDVTSDRQQSCGGLLYFGAEAIERTGDGDHSLHYAVMIEDRRGHRPRSRVALTEGYGVHLLPDPGQIKRQALGIGDGAGGECVEVVLTQLARLRPDRRRTAEPGEVTA